MLTEYLVYGLALRATSRRREHHVTAYRHTTLEGAPSVSGTDMQRGILLICIRICIVVPAGYIRMCVHDCSSRGWRPLPSIRS